MPDASSRLPAKPFFSSVRDSVCSIPAVFFLLFPCTCALHLLNKYIDIKLVVVVNAPLSVDKPVFLHSVNGLRASGGAGQTLFLTCTVFVQILPACESQPFCTFLPVDIHGLVHSWQRPANQHRPAKPADRRAGHGFPAGPHGEKLAACDVRLFANSRTLNENFFFEHAARSTSGLQPKSVYKDSSSVNNSPFLWISQLTDAKSLVYTRYKP